MRYFAPRRSAPLRSISGLVCAGLLLACSTLTGVAFGAAPAAGQGGYAVTQRWPLGEPSKWDYADVDPQRHRLYITRGDRVQVLDLPSGKPVGEIAGTTGVHGVAFAQDLKLGFTSNGRDNSVTVFGLDTLKVRQVLKVPGANPDAILYEAASHKLYTFNGKSADVTVIDARSLAVKATIKVGGKPEFAVADNAGKVYFNNEDKAAIGVIDVASDKLVASWPLAACEEPSGIAMDLAHRRLFSVCQNKVLVVTDADNGRQVASVAIGEHPDAAVYDAASATVLSSNGDGTLSVIHQADADHYGVPVTVATEKGARTMAMDHAGRQIFLPTVVDRQFTVLVAAPD
jgi:YVTN family beta-propeller protein